MDTIEIERCCYFKPGCFLLEKLRYMVTLSLGNDLDLASLESEVNFKGSHLFSVHKTIKIVST